MCALASFCSLGRWGMQFARCLQAPSLRGPMRDSIGCDDENFSSPKESRLRVSGERLYFLTQRYCFCPTLFDSMQKTARDCKRLCVSGFNSV